MHLLLERQSIIPNQSWIFDMRMPFVTLQVTLCYFIGGFYHFTILPKCLDGLTLERPPYFPTCHPQSHTYGQQDAKVNDN